MASPHYVVKKVGNNFEPVLASGSASGGNGIAPDNDLAAFAWLAGGSYVLLKGLAHRGLIGSALVAAGGCLVYRGITGKHINAAGPAARPHGGASYANDHRGSASQRPQDETEEASMESFPASDAAH